MARFRENLSSPPERCMMLVTPEWDADKEASQLSAVYQ